jgi:multiple sugar transport system substrate-binding protein
MLCLLVSCSRTETTGDQRSKDDPVTLKFYTQLLNLTDDDWQNTVVKPLKAKFPNISLELIPSSPERNIQALIASNDIPDILLTGRNLVVELNELGIPYDLTDDTKKFNLKLNDYKSGVIDTVKQYDPNHKLIGLPFYMNAAATFYNKDVFDKFGLSYPKAGMTWDEQISLAAKMARTDNGTPYYGLLPGAWPVMVDQMSLRTVAGTTAQLTADPIKRVFELQKKAYESQSEKKVLNPAKVLELFIKGQLAMMPYWINNTLGPLEQVNKEGNALNWDMTNFPSFAEKPGIMPPSGIYLLTVSNQSQHKEQAFQVVSHLSNSTEVQTIISKSARLTASKDAKINKVFGEDYQSIKGKNVGILLQYQGAPAVVPEKYDGVARKYLNQAVKEIVEKNVDINTSLRNANEKTNSEIKTLLNK